MDGGEGTTIPKDQQKAIQFFSQAAQQGHAAALTKMGTFHEAGVYGFKRDLNEALRYYTLAAEKGDVLAHTAIGDIYSHAQQHQGGGESEGGGVVPKRDLRRAIESYSAAAEAGHVPALHQLALIYAVGDVAGGVERNVVKAVALYQRAANLGDPHALWVVGTMLCAGDLGVVPKDEAKGREFFERAASQGHPPSQHALGVCWRDGVGGVVDVKKALKLLKASAKNGYPPARTTLGMMLLEGVSQREGGGESGGEEVVVVPKNVHGGIALLEEAVDQGDPDAMTQLGMVYATGMHLEGPQTQQATTNKSRAFSLFQSAVSKGEGHPLAHLFLGSLYEEGDNTLHPRVERNCERALYHYGKAAAQGLREGQYRLGLLYESGKESIAMDTRLACYWFAQAATQGHPDAQSRLDNLLSSSPPSEAG